MISRRFYRSIFFTSSSLSSSSSLLLRDASSIQGVPYGPYIPRCHGPTCTCGFVVGDTSISYRARTISFADQGASSVRPILRPMRQDTQQWIIVFTIASPVFHCSLFLRAIQDDQTTLAASHSSAAAAAADAARGIAQLFGPAATTMNKGFPLTDMHAIERCMTTVALLIGIMRLPPFARFMFPRRFYEQRAADIRVGRDKALPVSHLITLSPSARPNNLKRSGLLSSCS